MNYTIELIRSWIGSRKIKYESVSISLNKIIDSNKTSCTTRFTKSKLSKILSNKQSMTLDMLDVFSIYTGIDKAKLVSPSQWTEREIKNFLREREILKSNILNKYQFKEPIKKPQPRIIEVIRVLEVSKPPNQL